MDNPIAKSHLGLVIVLGSVWGLSEAGLGMGLRSCAAFVSGSVMTGVALFFMAAGWVVSRRGFRGAAHGAHSLGLQAVRRPASVASGQARRHRQPDFRFFHGSRGVHCYRLHCQGQADPKACGQALLGGIAAALAVNLFPLVRYATGVPACVVPGTGYPLSLFYIQVAVLVSFVTVPLGFLAGAKMESLAARLSKAGPEKSLNSSYHPLRSSFACSSSRCCGWPESAAGP